MRNLLLGPPEQLLSVFARQCDWGILPQCCGWKPQPRHLFLRRSLVPMLVMLTCSTPSSPVLSQEVPAEAQLAGPAAAVDDGPVQVPKREPQFEQLDEPYRMKLFRADPKLLEQKYVAWVRVLYVPRIDRRISPTAWLPNNMHKLLYYGKNSILSPHSSGAISEPEEVFSELVRNTPDADLPAGDIVSFFTDASDHGYLQFRDHIPFARDKVGREDGLYFQFRILAPSVDRAKELTNGLLTLYDQGFFRPALVRIAKVIRTEESELKGYEKAIRDAQEQLKTFESLLDSSPTITPEETTDLKTQRHLLDVDLAGANARVEAARRILSKRKSLRESRIEQVENIMVAAEIELAGLAARTKTLAAIIEKGENRAALVKKRQVAEDSLSSSQKAKLRCFQKLEVFRDSQRQLTPFQIVDGKVIIQPVEWTGSDSSGR